MTTTQPLGGLIRSVVGNVGGTTGEPEPPTLEVGRTRVYLGPLLGEGGFAFVYACRDVNEPSNQLVLKKVIIQDKAHQEQIEKEIRLLKVLQHPNIVRYHDDSVHSCADRLEALILMEHCEGGSLFEAIKSQGQQRLSKDAILRVAMDVSRAVATLHHHKPLPIAHRDLKLENILLAFHHGGKAGVENRVVYKLIDFGSATEGPVPLGNAVERAVEEERLAKTTTQIYRAPEMIDLYLRRALDEKVDIWALGCVLSTVMHLVHPFQGVGNLGVLNGKRRSVPAVPGWEDLEEVVNRMLLADADARLDIDEVLTHLTCLQDAKPLPSRPCDGPAQERERGGGRQGGDHRAAHVHSCPHEQKSTEHQILEARPLNPNSAAARRLAGRSRGHSASAPVTTETSVGRAEAAWVDKAKEAGSRQEGGRGKMGGFGGANLPFLEVSESREGDAIASDLLTEQVQALDVATQSTTKSTSVTRMTARGRDNGALSPFPATSTTASTVRKPSFDDEDFMQSSSLPERQGSRQEAGSPASFDPFANLHTRSNTFSHLSPPSPTFCSPPPASTVADKSMLAGFPSTMGQGGRVPQEDPPSFLSSTVSATPVRKDTTARTSGDFHALINSKKDSQALAAVTPPPKPPKPARPSLMKIPASAHDARFDAVPGVPHASLPSHLTTPGPHPPPLQVNQQFQQQQPSSIYPALSAYKSCEWQAQGQYQKQQVTQIQQEQHFLQLEKQRQTQPSTQMQWQQQQQQQQMGPCMQQQQQQQHQPQNFNPYNINNSILDTSSPQKVDAWSTSPQQQQQPSLPLQGHLSPPPYAYFLNGRDSNDFAGNQDNNGITTAHVHTGVRSQQGQDRPQSLERPGGGQHSRGNTDGSFGGNSRHSEPVFRSSFSSASSNGSNQADAFGYNLSSTFPTTRKNAGEYSPCPKAQQEEDRDPFEI